MAARKLASWRYIGPTMSAISFSRECPSITMTGRSKLDGISLMLAPEEALQKLTGYEHDGVTCIGLKTDIPVNNISAFKCAECLVILDEAIVELDSNFFWLGVGEIDLKLGIRTSKSIDFVKPLIVSCSGP